MWDFAHVRLSRWAVLPLPAVLGPPEAWLAGSPEQAALRDGLTPRTARRCAALACGLGPL